MPLLDKYMIGEGFLALWRQEESTAQLLSGLALSPAERARYGVLAAHPRRRKEWLTWHVMVRELLGSEVYTDYDPQGQPILTNHPGHISVSHARDRVALYYQPQRCGVDIEDCGRRFDRVSPRYISPEEQGLPESDGNRFSALMWCMKEAAYKFAGIEGLDLLRDIRVVRIDAALRRGEIVLKGERSLSIGYGFSGDYCLAYTLPTGFDDW